MWSPSGLRNKKTTQTVGEEYHLYHNWYLILQRLGDTTEQQREGITLSEKKQAQKAIHINLEIKTTYLSLKIFVPMEDK